MLLRSQPPSAPLPSFPKKILRLTNLLTLLLYLSLTLLPFAPPLPQAVYVNGSIEATQGGSVTDFAWLTGREAIALIRPQDGQQQRVWETIL